MFIPTADVINDIRVRYFIQYLLNIPVLFLCTNQSLVFIQILFVSSFFHLNFVIICYFYHYLKYVNISLLSLTLAWRLGGDAKRLRSIKIYSSWKNNNKVQMSVIVLMYICQWELSTTCNYFTTLQTDKIMLNKGDMKTRKLFCRIKGHKKYFKYLVSRL